MIEEKMMLYDLPAVVYGEPSYKCFLFIHGKGGNKEEAEAFAQVVCPLGWQVISADIPADSADMMPNIVCQRLRSIMIYIKERWSVWALRANSIGAWFAIAGLREETFALTLFLSPILDMTALIEKMMERSGVDSGELEKSGYIETQQGEQLSWDYYMFAKAHDSDRWNGDVELLFADNDPMTSSGTIKNYIEKNNAVLTVLKGGEHWFHTPEQLKFMKSWEESAIKRRNI